MKPIKSIDIYADYLKHKSQIDDAIQDVVNDADFIRGKAVGLFENDLATYLGEGDVVGVGNGTDALQISLQSLGLEPNDEVIVPSFTYFASAEVIALLGLKPVFVDVDPFTYTIQPDKIKAAISEKTKAVIVVHMYGNAADLSEIQKIVKSHSLFLIEDVAQAFGGEVVIKGKSKKLGTIGDLGCLSFFPTKNLGGFGDGGAIIVNRSNDRFQKIKMIANHGQSKRYVHDIIGINSRLDSIQAAVLKVKLRYLDDVNNQRINIATFYNNSFRDCDQIILPSVRIGAKHVYHQYTIVVKNGRRNSLKKYLELNGIPTRVYYPVPIHKQKAMEGFAKVPFPLDNTEILTDSILSLPMNVELEKEQLKYIVKKILDFFKSDD